MRSKIHLPHLDFAAATAVIVAQGVERERKDWPWNDWTWEARDQYAARAAAAALLPGAELAAAAVPNSDADGDKPVTITDVPSTDGSFTEGERTVLLVRRAMVVLARAPVFNANRAEALKMKEQGACNDVVIADFLYCFQELHSVMSR